MKFNDYREKPIPDSERRSCAEVLAAMDCLMHHMSDEDELGAWIQDGVQDNDHWRMNTPDQNRAEFYHDITEGMTYDDYEACVKIFACAVKAQCFKTKYQPRSFA